MQVEVYFNCFTILRSEFPETKNLVKQDFYSAKFEAIFFPVPQLPLENFCFSFKLAICKRYQIERLTLFNLTASSVESLNHLMA